MGQFEILRILKAEPDRWFDTTELSEICKVNICSISSRLKTLRHLNFVMYKIISIPKGPNKRYCYKHKRN